MLDNIKDYCLEVEMIYLKVGLKDGYLALIMIQNMELYNYKVVHVD